MKQSASNLGRYLYALLPSVYHERDNSDRVLNRGERDRYNGDLGRYLLACGDLLDRIHATLEQRLADGFPDDPLDGLACQDWLLPYFAQLLDVRLVSPHVKGRRAEISNAVAWRQRKGTLTCVEEIAESVGQVEAEIHEGWRRVAVTPRIGKPLLSARALGYATEPQRDPATDLFLHPTLGARHPGLPAASVDFRCPSRAVDVRPDDEDNPAAKLTSFDGTLVPWRQASVHGVPCFPGSYEDVSARTVDLRTPNWRHGHHHPRRLLLHTPPPAGFFPTGAPSIEWSERGTAAFGALIEEIPPEQTDGVRWIFRNRSLGTDTFVPVILRGVIEFGVQAGPHDQTYRFEGLHLENTLLIHSGRVELQRCAAHELEIHTTGTDEPVLTAEDSLIGSIQAAGGLCQLEYCSVLTECVIEVVRASDCIFLGCLRRHDEQLPPLSTGCVRYSRLHPQQATDAMRVFQVTGDPVAMFTQVVGDRSCGVLHPATSVAIRFGAEDRGEMGAYHGFRYSLQAAAIVDKLRDHLPVGVEAVLIPDERLLRPPPSV